MIPASAPLLSPLSRPATDVVTLVAIVDANETSACVEAVVALSVVDTLCVAVLVEIDMRVVASVLLVLVDTAVVDADSVVSVTNKLAIEEAKAAWVCE